MRRSAGWVVAWCCLCAFVAGGAWQAAEAAERVEGAWVADRAGEAEPAWRGPAFPRDWTSRIAFAELPVERIVRMEQRNAAGGRQPVQVGIARRVEPGAASTPVSLRWKPVAGGGAVTRFRVESPDAMALRVGLQLDRLPTGTELRFSGSSEPQRVVATVPALDAERLAEAGLYWTPATDGQAQEVEVSVARAADAAHVSLRVEQVSHLLADSRNSFKLTKIGESGACNVDVACRAGELGAPFAVAKKAVAHMLFVVGGSSYICTGTLLNDTVAGSSIPYFYSANHCIDNQAVANTLNTFWNYEATACMSGVSASTTQRSGGATMLYANADTDALLLRLNDAAPAGAAFAGWDAAAVASGRDVVAIHHPAGDAKKVSLGRTTGSNASRLQAGWLSGTTEGGSSGGGLFVRGTSSYHLVGGLYGGSASCASSGNLSNASNRDSFSRFDKAYPAIKAWLSPTTGGTSNVAPVADFSSSASGRTVTFTDASSDSDGTVATRRWLFGDGGTSAQRNPVRTYAADGTYTVRLTVTDDDGATHFTTRQVTVSSGASAMPLTNGRAVTGLSGAQDSSRRYTIAVPAGALDLVVTTSGGSGDADLYVRRGAPPTTTSYECRSYSATSSENCTIASPQAGTWHVLVHGFGSYTNVRLTATYQVATNENPGGAAQDFNGDGKSDILWRHTGNRGQRLWLGANRNTAASLAQLPGTAWSPVAIGDFDGDGKADVFLRNGVSGANEMWPGGNAAARVAVTRLADRRWQVAGSGDFDGDGEADLLWRHSTTGNNAIWRSARFSTQQSVARVADLAWNVGGVGDFDGDGRADILWLHPVNANQAWRSGNNATRITVAAASSADQMLAGIGDFDGDGEDDLLWRDMRLGKNTVWPAARFGERRVLGTMADLRWKVAGTGDYDGDGSSDVLWRHAGNGKNLVWRSARAATPQAVTREPELKWTVVGGIAAP